MNWKLIFGSSEIALQIAAWVTHWPDIRAYAVASLGPTLKSFAEEVSRNPGVRLEDVRVV